MSFGKIEFYFKGGKKPSNYEIMTDYLGFLDKMNVSKFIEMLHFDIGKECIFSLIEKYQFDKNKTIVSFNGEYIYPYDIELSTFSIFDNDIKLRFFIFTEPEN